nr:extensin family protein [Ancylobacter lacus]
MRHRVRVTAAVAGVFGLVSGGSGGGVLPYFGTPTAVAGQAGEVIDEAGASINRQLRGLFDLGPSGAGRTPRKPRSTARPAGRPAALADPSPPGRSTATVPAPLPRPAAAGAASPDPAAPASAGSVPPAATAAPAPSPTTSAAPPPPSSPAEAITGAEVPLPPQRPGAVAGGEEEGPRPAGLRGADRRPGAATPPGRANPPPRPPGIPADAQDPSAPTTDVAAERAPAATPAAAKPEPAKPEPAIPGSAIPGATTPADPAHARTPDGGGPGREERATRSARLAFVPSPLPRPEVFQPAALPPAAGDTVPAAAPVPGQAAGPEAPEHAPVPPSPPPAPRASATPAEPESGATPALPTPAPQPAAPSPAPGAAPPAEGAAPALPSSAPPAPGPAGLAGTCPALAAADIAVFTPVPAPIPAAEGCGIEQPVELSAVRATNGRLVRLEPAALLRCDMAEAVARWVREDVEPAVARLGSPLDAVLVAGSYDCRPRNGVAGGKMSEHGRGNAMDTRGYRLENGREVEIGGTGDAAMSAAFQTELRASACLRFTTVLGPGSDGYHEEHLHVDRIERRAGAYCQWAVAGRPPDAPSGRPTTKGALPAEAPPH